MDEQFREHGAMLILAAWPGFLISGPWVLPRNIRPRDYFGDDSSLQLFVVAKIPPSSRLSRDKLWKLAKHVRNHHLARWRRGEFWMYTKV